MKSPSFSTAREFLATLNNVIDDANQLESVLTRLFQKLTKHGIQVSVNTDTMMANVQYGLQAVHKQGEELLGQLDQLQELVRSSALITNSLELDQVLEEVMDTVITLTGAERAYLMLRDRASGELMPYKARNWDHKNLPEHEIVFSRSVVAAALAQAEPVVSTNAQNDARFQSTDSVISQGLRSILCIPLILNREVVGVMYADNRIHQGVFSQERIPLLATFGTQAAMAIEKARLHEEEIARHRLEEELALGKTIQLSLLPKNTPTFPGWEFATAYQPARLVGGDFYDFFELPDNPTLIGIVIADVADKGVPAALFMALSRTIIRTMALAGSEPSEALTRANKLILKDSQSGLFLTAFYAVLDSSTGRLVYANAGHNRPLWLHSETGEFTALSARGIVLGLFENVTLEDREIVTAPGDLIVFYTDGITEAMNEAGEMFGEHRLRQTIAANRDSSAQAILDALTAAVEEFIGEAPQSDDFTVVIVKCE